MNYDNDKSPRRQQFQDRGHQRARHAEPAANPRANYQRYITLARESVSTGDAVQTENWYQHADHYFRMMRDPAS